jgi:hypothetical protein
MYSMIALIARIPPTVMTIYRDERDSARCEHPKLYRTDRPAYC